MRESQAAPVVREPLVLVVDDDRSVLEALSALLAPRIEPLFHLEAVASGEEALEVMEVRNRAGRESPLALVISDEKMPGMTGNDLLVALRRNALHRDGGRILVTGYAGLASAKRAINEAEVDKYFPKPWDTEGALLPAVREILHRFVQRSGLGSFLITESLGDQDDLTPVFECRREWWLYLANLGEEPEDGMPPPDAFREPEDAGARHVLVRRERLAAPRPAASIRLRRESDATWILDRLAFWPEEACDGTETLLLRAALLEAGRQRAKEVRASVPRLRREIYEALGFAPCTDPTADKAGATVTVEIPMVCRPEPLPGQAAATDPFTRRFAKAGRLCACQQTGCATRDYAEERRGYFCPLDLHEGRVPQGFPLRG